MADLSVIDRLRIERVVWSLDQRLFLLTTTLVLTSVLFEAANAFGDGILAGDPDATGTFRWPGIAYLQTAVTYTVTDGEHAPHPSQARSGP